MTERDEVGRDYFRRMDASRVENDEGIELAFLLQNSSGNDPDLLKSLVDGYIVDLYRWVKVLMYYQRGTDPSREQILSILRAVFARAIAHPEQFHGQASVASWLFEICYQAVRRSAAADWIVLNVYKYPAPQSPPGAAEPYWQRLALLPEKLRTALLLRYLFQWDIRAIAELLNTHPVDAHKRLVRGRERLFPGTPDNHMYSQLQAYMDCFLDEDPDELSLLTQHLDTCTSCQSFMRQMNDFERSLTGDLEAHWHATMLNQVEIGEFLASVMAMIDGQNRTWKPWINVRQAAWILGISIVFIGLAVMFIRMTPVEREFPQAPAPTPQPLPPVLNMRPQLVPAQGAGTAVQVPQYIAKAFSSDGNWGVFTTISIDASTRTDVLSSVELYDRSTNSIQVIEKSTTVLDLPWVYWDLAPAISGDGRYIVYLGSSSDPAIKGAPCTNVKKQPCLDVLVYDRTAGTTQRLTQAAGGGAADGNSLAPAISVDGAWVAFWSAAGNLIPNSKDACAQKGNGILCLDIYLYNLQTGKIELIPVGTIPGDVVYGVDRISLSSDGRYVGFTITPASQVGNETLHMDSPVGPSASMTGASSTSPGDGNIQQSSEAVVYDRQTGKYELENQSSDGAPGNGPYSTPVLSADGRYVAFVSAASNLVAGDYNKFTDVFIRDRQTGAVQLASISSESLQGNNDSGVTYWGRGYFSLNLTPDGRYVVFESAATNLASDAAKACTPVLATSCNLLYVHDRQTGKTDFISSLSNIDLSFFPDISADGRWVSFVQFVNRCLPVQNFCSNAMLYDRQNGWIADLTRYGQASSNLPWNYSAGLQLPWQSWESSALAFSPDGRFFAVGGFDANVRVWRIANGIKSIDQKNPDYLISTGGDDYFSTVAFSNDSRWLAAGTFRGLVYIWDINNNKMLYKLNHQNDPVRKLVFSQDGSHLVISTIAETWIWTIGSEQLIQETHITYGETAVYALDVSPQGNLLATARGDGTVWLQHLPGGQVIGRLGGQQVVVDSLAFSPDGSMLAARSGQGSINLWKIEGVDMGAPSYTLISTISSDMYVGALIFSPDNKYLTSTGMVGDVTFWSIPEGKIYTLQSPPTNEMVFGAAFSITGDMLAVLFEDQVGLWNYPPGYASIYYNHSTSDSISTGQPLTLSFSTDNPEFLSSPNSPTSRGLTLDQAAQKLDFPLIVPEHLPANFEFLHAAINIDGSVTLAYEDYRQPTYFVGTLYINELLVGNKAPPKMTIGAGAEVHLTQLDTAGRTIPAEFVQGDWLFAQAQRQAQGDNSQEPSTWVWDASSLSMRLRWEQQGILIAIYYQVTPLIYAGESGQALVDPARQVSSLSQYDLAQIAAGMTWFNQIKTGLACPQAAQAGTGTKGTAGSAGGPACLQLYHVRLYNLFAGAIVTK